MENRQINKKIYITKDEIIPMAQRMHSEGRALLLIHGHRDEDGKPIVSYEFFVDQDIESYEVQGEEVLPDITDIYDLAAQWPEREINELLGIQFEGLDTSERMFLPDNMAEEMVGHIMVTPLEELRTANGLGPEDS